MTAALTCPDHGTDLEYVRSEDGQEFWACAVRGCQRGEWIS